MPNVYWPITLDPADTGLTLEIQEYDLGGAPVHSPITSGFTEVGNGIYLWEGSLDTYPAFIVLQDQNTGTKKAARAVTNLDVLNVGTDGRVYAEVLTMDVSIGGSILGVVYGDPNYGTIANAAPGVKLATTDHTSIAAAVWNRLTSALTTAGSIGKYLLDQLGLITAETITISPPVGEGDMVTIIRGDTYGGAGNAALAWTVTTALNLATATLSLTLRTHLEDTTVGTVTAVLVSGTTWTISAALTAAQTALLGTGSGSYAVRGTWGTTVVTLVSGDLTVERVPAA